MSNPHYVFCRRCRVYFHDFFPVSTLPVSGGASTWSFGEEFPWTMIHPYQRRVTVADSLPASHSRRASICADSHVNSRAIQMGIRRNNPTHTASMMVSAFIAFSGCFVPREFRDPAGVLLMVRTAHRNDSASVVFPPFQEPRTRG